MSMGLSMSAVGELEVPRAVAEVIAAIEADVIRGRILPRTRLIEDHLMEDYGAKRHTVRSALTELQRLGVVVKPPRRGAELRRFDAQDLDKLYAMRAVLHGAAVAMMPLPPDREAQALLEDARRRHELAAGGGDLTLIHRTNMAFHRALYGLCGNRYVAESIRLHDWLSFPARAYGAADSGALRQACEEHAAMTRAACSGDKEGLAALAVRHMERARRIYEAKFLDGAGGP